MDGPDPRLLEQLRDLHFPAPPPSWPPAAGWWIAALVGLVLLVIVYRVWQRHTRRNPSHQTAELQEALQQWHTHHDTARYLHAVNQILRRYALVRDGRTTIARLQGDSWQHWLSADIADGSPSGLSSPLSSATLQALTHECYQAAPRRSC